MDLLVKRPLLLAALLASPAAADPLVLRALGGMVYDSNVFRLPDGVQPVSDGGRNDLILQAQAGVRAEANLSLQQFVIDAAATRYDFRDHKDLSFTGIAATGTWNWRVGTKFSGSAGYDLQRRQTSFAEFRQLGRNIVTVRQPFFEARYRPGSDWFAYGSYRYTNADNSAISLEVADYTSNVYAGGLGYSLRNAGEFRLGVRRNETDFPTDQAVIIGGVPLPVRNDFRQDEIEASVIFPLGSRTALTGRLAYTERKVEQLSARDFSGFTGRLVIDYRPSPLFAFQVFARRELTGQDDIQTNFVTSDVVNGSIQYAPRDYVTLRLEAERSTRDYEGFALVAPTIGRKDHNRSVALSGGYAWRLGNRLDLTVRRETRHSTIAQLDYTASTASATLTLVFGGPQVSP